MDRHSHHGYGEIIHKCMCVYVMANYKEKISVHLSHQNLIACFNCCCIACVISFIFLQIIT